MTQSFFKDIVKEIDNDYAGLLSDGSIGDSVVTSTAVLTFLMPWLVGLSMVVFHQTRSLQLQENLVQVRPSSVLVWYKVSLPMIQMQV